MVRGVFPASLPRRPKSCSYGQPSAPSPDIALVAPWAVFENTFLIQGSKQLHSWKVLDYSAMCRTDFISTFTMQAKQQVNFS